LKFKTLAVSLLLTVFFFCGIDTKADTPNSGVFHKGEYLKYEASFWGITLGTIEMYQDSVGKFRGKPMVFLRSEMKSNSSIPFLFLDAKFYSKMDTSFNFVHKFKADVRFGSNQTYQDIYFDYKNNNLKYRAWENGKLTDSLSISNQKKWNDGTSLYFFSRNNIENEKANRVATMVSKDTSSTLFKFNLRREAVEIDAFDYPISSIYFQGEALWDGVYGMNGEFESWFSDDEAHIPLLSYVRVYLGSVKIELVEWRRSGWNPSPFITKE
jgi:Protein of unknown function (DUF3108)